MAAGFQSLQKNGGRRCAGRHYRLPQGCSTPAPNAHPPTKNTIINATRDSRLGVQHQSSLHANLASEIYFRENIFTFCNTSGAGPENERRAHPQCRSSTSWRTGQSCLPSTKGGWHAPHHPPAQRWHTPTNAPSPPRKANHSAKAAICVVGFPSLTAIPRRMHRISFDLRS